MDAQMRDAYNRHAAVFCTLSANRVNRAASALGRMAWLLSEHKHGEPTLTTWYRALSPAGFLAQSVRRLKRSSHCQGYSLR
jgi:hypothetical protein